MKLKCEKTKSLKNKSQRKTLKKTLDRNINEDQNQLPKTLVFFDFLTL